MDFAKLRKFIPPLEVVLTLALMSLLLLSFVFYYRAVRTQRFSELALAIYEPQNAFRQKTISPFVKLFDKKKINNVRFTENSFCIEESLLLMDELNSKVDQPSIMKDLSKIFYAILQDPEIQPTVELVLISTIEPLGSGMSQTNKKFRSQQENSDSVLRSLFEAEPELEQKYSSFFASMVTSNADVERNQCLIEFRFIPNNRLYTTYLQRVHI